MPKHRTPDQQLRDNPATHVDIMSVSEVYCSKSKAKPEKVVLSKLVHGNHGWIDVPGEEKRRYVLFSLPQKIFLSPSQFHTSKAERARANRIRHPWHAIRAHMEEVYSPRPA